MEVGGWLDAPAALLPGKYPPYTHWIGDGDILKKNIFPLPGFDPRIVQPVAVLTAVYRLWLSTVRVKIYRSSVTSADVNIVVPMLWENRLSQHLGAAISEFLHTSRTPPPSGQHGVDQNTTTLIFSVVKTCTQAVMIREWPVVNMYGEGRSRSWLISKTCPASFLHLCDNC